MPRYVIGHRNPDTDAICSAIAYAELLTLQGRPAQAARCGEVNARTQFALEQAQLPQPRLVMDVRPTAGQICRRDIIHADVNDSLLAAFNRMRGRGLRSLPLLDQHGSFHGMLSLLKMVDLLLPASGGEEARKVHTTLERIRCAIGGTFLNADRIDEEQEFTVTVGAMSASVFVERLHQFDAKRVILVTGDRPTVQEPAIEYGVRCLVVTGDYHLEPTLIEKARQRGVSVLLSPHDTASTTVLIKCAKRAMDALLDQPIEFLENDPVELVRERATASSQVLFPVLNSEGGLIGVLSKSDLLDPPLTELILVDHNEFSQAVNGIEYANIVEVVDHHRLGGGLSTREPIRFINEPLGSTCTLVARMFRDQHVALSPSIALCLATGIISDTLTLTSPTTTDTDRVILPWLEQVAGRPLKDYAESFFAAGSVLQIQTAEEAVRGDCKEYVEADWRLAVAQIEELGLERFWKRKKDLHDALETMRRERSLDFACLFVTDIGLHYSILLVSGEPVLCKSIDYPQLEEGVFELDGIVSRKKQLLPHLCRVFSQIRRS
ncbi:MAG: putative manganese-dependent inorganic diphosphatase [Candidatus Methylacidiphilales bacterium]